MWNSIKVTFDVTIVIMFLAVVFGCSNPVEPQLEIIEIHNKTDADLSLADVASSIEILPLETIEDALISSIYDIQIFDGKFFVKDRNRQILVFDNEGNFKRNLLQLGEGPGEAKTVLSFAIDEESGKIYVSDLRKLLVYSEKLEFLKENLFPINLNYLTVLGGKPHVISEFNMKPVDTRFSNEAILFEVGSQLEFTDSLSLRHVVLDQKMILGFPNRNFISSIGNENYVYTPTPPIDKVFRDTLFQIQDGKLLPSFKLDFEAPHFDEKGDKAIMILNMFLAKDYLICEYNIENKKKVFLFDRKSKRGFNLNEGFLDDQGDKVGLRPLDLTNNVFYYAKEAKYSDTSKEEANPIIGIVRLK